MIALKALILNLSKPGCHLVLSLTKLGQFLVNISFSYKYIMELIINR